MKIHRNVVTKDIVTALEEHWFNWIGPPEIIRHDPEGAFVSTELIQEMSRRGVQLQATAGEAHWQLGIVERSIQTIMEVAKRIAAEYQLEIDEAILESVTAHNTTERVHGYTPAQWAFGRSPNWTGTMYPEVDEQTKLARDLSVDFQAKLNRQINARKIYEEENLRQKFQRAARARHRKDNVFIPGEIVYIWRLGLHKMPARDKENWFAQRSLVRSRMCTRHRVTGSRGDNRSYRNSLGCHQ